MTSIETTAIIQSPLIGTHTGTPFSDVATGAFHPSLWMYAYFKFGAVSGPNNSTINTTNPIKNIRVIYGLVVSHQHFGFCVLPG
jgi:hypothetical protein